MANWLAEIDDAIELRGLAANAMRERDSLRAQFAQLQAQTGELGSRLMAERDAAIARADHLEARIVALIDAAHTGPVDVPPDMSREVARMVNAVRINVRLRERAERRRQLAEEEVEALAADLARAGESAVEYEQALVGDAVEREREAIAAFAIDYADSQDRLGVSPGTGAALREFAADIRANAHRKEVDGG